VNAAAISEVLAVKDALSWYVGALGELRAVLSAQRKTVAQHALAVEGPLREYYLVGPQETADESAWRTEIGWPIFQIG